MDFIFCIKNRSVLLNALSFMTILFLSSFHELQHKKQEIVGKWNAKWTITDEDNQRKGNEHEMKGYMNFSQNGLVQIKAFGYNGCVFSNDTIENELAYIVTSDSLILYNKQAHFNLTYLITTSSDREFKLQLMDDILITLTR